MLISAFVFYRTSAPDTHGETNDSGAIEPSREAKFARESIDSVDVQDDVRGVSADAVSDL